MSLHGDPSRAYPYFSGSTAETGEGDGVGFTLNFPLPAGCSDDTYTAALQQATARVAQFQPHYVVVSLGIDTFTGDPLGDFCLTRAGYSSIGSIIGALRVPTMYSNPPPPPPPSVTPLCRYVMEGGYVVAELGNNVAAVLLGHEQAAGL